MAKQIGTRNNKLNVDKRMRKKYTLSIINESSLEEVYRTRLSGYNIFVVVMLTFIVLFALFSVLIIFTPLRNLLPENTDYTLRKEVANHAISMDSLQRIVELNQRYLDNVNGIFSGKLEIDENDNIDSVVRKTANLQFMEKSSAEKAFCEKFEEDEMYNFSNGDLHEREMTFLRPTYGIVTRKFNPAEGHYGIDISTDEGAAISSVQEGVVLSSGYDPIDGYYIEILHKDNYLSVYRGAAESFKKTGDVVKSGEAVGIVGIHDQREKPMLHFELWNAMQPQNPLNYIVVE